MLSIAIASDHHRRPPAHHPHQHTRTHRAASPSNPKPFSSLPAAHTRVACFPNKRPRMNYLSSLAKTWSSINPATLSGAIDVIVIEDEKGNLNCSPFHIRFGKFQLLRPSQKKVNFKVNGHLTNIQMKLGDGGEAFFVFQTADSVDRIPNDMMTSPVVSAVSSAASSPLGSPLASPLASPKSEPGGLEEPPYLDIGPSEEPEHIDSTATNSNHSTGSKSNSPTPQPYRRRSFGNQSGQNGLTKSSDAILDGAATASSPSFTSSSYPSDNVSPPSPSSSPPSAAGNSADHHFVSEMKKSRTMSSIRSLSPGRAQKLSKTLTLKNIPTKIDSNGELVLDMSGYKASEEDVQNYDNVIKDLLKDEFGQDFDLSDIISYDQEGKVRIYSSANEEDDPNATQLLNAPLITSSSDLSDVEGATTAPVDLPSENATPSSTAGSDSTGTGTGTGSAAGSATTGSDSGTAGIDTTTSSSSTSSSSRINFIKTLRLTSEQLKCLNLKYGANDMEFTVDKSKSTITSKIFLWKYNVPVVISDIDGTITKSDALGHVFTMIGKDWTHLGVSKLFSDIKLNGYNIMYLTARSVGLADTTRAYLNGIEQDGVKIPQGPVILSPDRTMAALRREVILKKPEVFKITCLKDLRTLYGNINKTPFYAGFGNRITDALSYRSVDIPSSRIFTINTDGDVHMELLELAGYKSSYIHINELVDHFFPPVNVDLLSTDEKRDGVNVFTDENFTDTVYWRDPIPEFSDSEDDDDSVNQNPSPSQNGPGNAAGGRSSTTTNATGNLNDSSSRSVSAQTQQNMPKMPEVSAADLEALTGNIKIQDKRDSIGSVNDGRKSDGMDSSNNYAHRKLSLSPHKNDTIKDAVQKGKLSPDRHNDSISNNYNNSYNGSNSQNNKININANTTGNYNNTNNTLNILNAEYNDEGEEDDSDYSPSELSFEDDYLNNDDLIDDELDEYNNSVDDLEGHFDDDDDDDDEDNDDEEDVEHSDDTDDSYDSDEHSGDEVNGDGNRVKNTKKSLPKT